MPLYQRPFLKWAGNKYQCLQHILPHITQKSKIIEPFMGSGAITLNTDFNESILIDNNADLIFLFSTIQKQGLQFIQKAQYYFQEKFNDINKYITIREKFNASTDPEERAIYFLYLNRHGYNGLCRYNLKGGYNVPFGQYKKPYFPEKEILMFIEKSKTSSVKLIHGDFTHSQAFCDTDTIVYFDPPYVPLSPTSSFSQYSSTKFTESEHVRLKNFIHDIKSSGVDIIVSNHDTPFTRNLYQDADIISFEVNRFISCKSMERKKARELIAIYK